MDAIQGDLWDWHKRGYWCCITTNFAVNKQGLAVMGRGVALEATKRFPTIQRELGELLLKEHRPYVFPKYKLISFPVKYSWEQAADLDLIERSSNWLARLITKWNELADNTIWNPDEDAIVLPKPGCGNGRLTWADVKPRLNALNELSVIVIDKNYVR